jgi:septum site-determining protein MinD
MIVAVTGGKGGVGKSTVALNLAHALDGLLVDADLAMADLPSGRGPDLHDVLAGRANAMEAVGRCHGLGILPCGRTLAGARAADVTALEPVLDRLARRLGDVVVDCPAGLSADAGVPLLVADAVVVVTEATPAAMGDAIRARELARALDAPLAAVAVNRARQPDERAIADALGAPVTTIPDSPTLHRAQRQGRPVASLAPEASAAEAVAALARALQSARSST